MICTCFQRCFIRDMTLFLTDTICPVAQKSNYDEDKVPLSQVAFSFSVRPLYGPKLHNFIHS